MHRHVLVKKPAPPIAAARAQDGDDLPVDRQTIETLLKDLAAHRVDHNGNALAVRELPHVLDEIGLAIIDHIVCVQDVPTKRDGLFSTCRRDDAASMESRKLHCNVPDATRTRMDQHRLPRLDASTQVQSFPCCLTNERQCCSGRMIDSRRLASCATSVDGSVIGVCTIAEQIGRRKDFVTHIPLLRAGTAAYDDAADVVTENERERTTATTTGLPYFRVHRIHRSRMHFDENVGIPQRRLGPLFDIQNVRAAIGVKNGCAHRDSPAVSSMSYSNRATDQARINRFS